MTTSLQTYPNESLLIGNPFSQTTASAPARVIYREFTITPPKTIPDSIDLDELLAEFEADEEMAGHLAEARKDLAATLYRDEPATFSAIRLSKGMSQKALAESAGTSQSYIARIEAGQVDPGTEQIAKIAEALGADETEVFRSIRLQRATREIRA